ncbi:hypothetical protein ACJIZ3_023778 [Penstemon smallii]|uniref:Uncharacterized protein n=1 Tax=Penstemon smallii TaxID=265156 RepID=A0ABD3TR03_9LAMI
MQEGGEDRVLTKPYYLNSLTPPPPPCRRCTTTVTTTSQEEILCRRGCEKLISFYFQFLACCMCNKPFPINWLTVDQRQSW